MMERYKEYWIYASAIPGPPNTRYWESKVSILKDGPQGSVVEVGRITDRGINFDLQGVAVWYAQHLGEIAVDHCLPPA
jgi:hypothetical protein